MLRPFKQLFVLHATVCLLTMAYAHAQTPATPKVVVPTGARPTAPSRPVSPSSRILYPWKTYITITVFWIGETPTQNNPTPNHKSSWDQKWAQNFGGFDDPDPANRIANHTTGDFRPKAFTPKLNPFYIALPYNDVINHQAHKPEASRVIPWFSRMRPEPGDTVCKGRWIQIHRNGISCYAQWEDCGPWLTDDWEYVFGNKPPRTKSNGSAGLDISPAVRDYLRIRSGDKVHWRFVEESQVPYGPWKKYGQTAAASGASSGTDLAARQKYLQYLRELRDTEYQKESVRDLQR